MQHHISNKSITIDYTKNKNLTSFGKAVLKDRYLIQGESDYQDCFARVSTYYADDIAHAQRIYNYMSNLWFMPATPILTNGGTKRGLPISCFLNEVEDNLVGIAGKWNENVWLAAKGGGIGTYWGNVRSIGENISNSGSTSGIIPFVCVQDRLTLAISQGSCRRGASVAYLPVWHPEIEEFIEIRRPTGGDPSRKALFLHHAVVISDEFMHAVENDDKWDLISPADGSIKETCKARDLWIRILSARVETGEPYLLFSDTIDRMRPEIYKKLGLTVKTSNLCNEIVLSTGPDFSDTVRTAVCCLSSLNLYHYDQWKGNKEFIRDILLFLDNVMQDFIEKAPKTFKDAVYSAQRERSIGLGVMGFHSFLQSKMVPWESATAKAWNNKIFKYIHEEVNKASQEIAVIKGPCPDAELAGVQERFAHKTAIAPTASISIIAGNTSPGIEPYNANSFTQKTLTGSFNIKNQDLQKLLESKGQNTDETWSSIMMNEGSVQHLDFLSEHEKNVFKTAFEIDQRWLIDLAADRTKYICQSQSLNVFIPADIHKKDLHELHYMAWKKGVKGMYYCRSKSLQRADKISSQHVEDNKPEQLEINLSPAINTKKFTDGSGNNDDECLACQ